MAKCVILLLAFGLSSQTSALIELSGSYGYDRSVYGKNKQDKKTDRTYSGGFAFYLLQLTAIEFIYSKSEKMTSERPLARVSNSDYRVEKSINSVISTIYGVSIKQALASRQSLFRPSISLGYAKLRLSDQKIYTFVNIMTKEPMVNTGKKEKTEEDSFYAELVLQMKLTSFFSLQCSLQSVMPDFDFSQAKDSMKYLVGFSWFL